LLRSYSITLHRSIVILPENNYIGGEAAAYIFSDITASVSQWTAAHLIDGGTPWHGADPAEWAG